MFGTSNAKRRPWLKRSAVKASIIIALGLAIWAFFYVKSVPLTPPETTVVVGTCAASVLVGDWIWSSLRKRRAGKG
jgi:hypothetical protein